MVVRYNQKLARGADLRAKRSGKPHRWIAIEGERVICARCAMWREWPGARADCSITNTHAPEFRGRKIALANASAE